MPKYFDFKKSEKNKRNYEIAKTLRKEHARLTRIVYKHLTAYPEGTEISNAMALLYDEVINSPRS